MIERISFSIAVDITGIVGMLFILFSSTNGFKKQDDKYGILNRVYILIILTLLSDLVVCICGGRHHAQVPLYVAGTAAIVFSDMMIMEYTHFTRLQLQLRQETCRIETYILYGVHTAMIILAITNPIHRKLYLINSATGRMETGPLYTLLIAVFCLSFLENLAVTMYRKEPSLGKRLPLMMFCVLLLTGCILQWRYTGVAMADMFALFGALVLFSTRNLEKDREFTRKDVELESTRAALVLSQIQPHFLFNSMAAVMDLCDTDPAEAKAALQELSDYLHYKLSAMSHSDVVPFREDLEFLNNYLRLEKRRYGDRLQVSYDIGCEEFRIPLLTLQPLVENAIRHGISRRQKGGTVTITTREDDRSFQIRVEDNGVGFDASRVIEYNSDHIGLYNVRKRLSALCNATLLVNSTAGEGTTIEITVPKGEKI